jgi:hypothetical protein
MITAASATIAVTAAAAAAAATAKATAEIVKDVASMYDDIGKIKSVKNSMNDSVGIDNKKTIPAAKDIPKADSEFKNPHKTSDLATAFDLPSAMTSVVEESHIPSKKMVNMPDNSDVTAKEFYIKANGSLLKCTPITIANFMQEVGTPLKV